MLYAELLRSSRAAGLSHRRPAVPGTIYPKPYPVCSSDTPRSIHTSVERCRETPVKMQKTSPGDSAAAESRCRLPTAVVSSACSSRFRFFVFGDDDDDKPSILPLTRPFKRARFENVSGTRFSAPTEEPGRASPLMGAEDPLGRGKVPVELAQPLLRGRWRSS